MYFLLGASIALAAMLLINSFASLTASLLWKVVRRLSIRWSAASRASLLYALRILPFAVGVISVGLLFLPAYFTYEPRTDHEDISLKLTVVSLFSAVGIVLAVVRGVVTWRATSKLRNEWLNKATPITLEGINVPSYLIEHQFPVVAVVGMFRPRLFVANQILSTLTPNELAAAVQHECGHIVARDNLKRSLMRACRDSLLLIPCGRPLDEAWKEASETSADEHAAQRGRIVALDLASALVKISRLIPRGITPAIPAAALLVGHGEEGSVRNRVAHLLNFTAHRRRSDFIGRAPFWICALLFVLTTIVTLNEPHVLAAVHSLIEHGVYILS